MRLRPAAREEIDAFVALLVDAAGWMQTRGIEQLRPGSMIAQRGALADAQAASELFVADDSGRIVGGCVLSAQPDPIWTDRPDPSAWYLSKLVVARNRTGEGLGRWILAAAESHARERGARWLRLDCVASNEPLARYYQQLGYYPRGAIRGLLRHDKRLVPEQGVAVASLDAVDFEKWQTDRVATLMFVVRGGQMLLIRKLRGHGAGKINGPGGMVEPGESPLQCALREIEEEVGVRALDVTPLTRLCFQDADGSRMLGYAFMAQDCLGEPRETAEAVPFWCPVDHIPYVEMWDDDVLWLPLLLARVPTTGEFLMRDERLVAHRLRSMTVAELTRLTNRRID
jgi:8-oxo-dGTP diphosphatase